MRRVIFWLVGLALAGGAAFAIPRFVSADDGSSNPPSGAGREPRRDGADGHRAGPPELLTSDGFTKLRDDMRAKIGNTRYLSAVIYPDYATIEVPITGDPDHSQRWYYNGSFPYNPIESPRKAGSKAADLRSVA